MSLSKNTRPLLLAVLIAIGALAGPSAPFAAPKAKAAVATSPYLCTPSGFGHKARCYLRSGQSA